MNTYFTCIYVHTHVYTYNTHTHTIIRLDRVLSTQLPLKTDTKHLGKPGWQAQFHRCLFYHSPFI